MSVRRHLASLGLVFVVAGCGENLSPPAAVAPTAHLVNWDASALRTFSATGAVSEQLVTPKGGLVTANDISLTSYQASFWAVRGQYRTLTMYYSAGGGTSRFLRLSIIDPAYVPGRGYLATGDSVLVTATVDPTAMAVTFEPNGMQFGYPAQLKIWYGGAGGDLNSDGVVDSQDSYIESQLLGMWWHENDSDPWTPISATKSLTDKSITAPLAHFSGYSVAW
jgi:hypothetical protein